MSTAVSVLVTAAAAQTQFDDLGKRHLPTDNGLTEAVVLGDVDGDGDSDLIAGGRWQTRLFLNDGNGRYTDATSSRMPVDSDVTHAVALGDVDGDGVPDLALANAGYPGQQNRLYLNNGAGTFIDATAGRMPTHLDCTSTVALVDVDGDGDADLVFGNFDQQNRLYLNDGTGRFMDATTAHMPVDLDNTLAVASGDVDGDGDADLVFGNVNQQNRLYLNDGTGRFTDATAPRMPIDNDSTFGVALGDIDLDGDPDVVLGDPGQDRLYLNDGTGTFADATAVRMPTARGLTNAVALGDVDGDGDPDLVFGSGGQDRLYLNDGTGVFTDATVARMPIDRDLTYAVALGDVDGDGDPDLVLGNSRNRNRLYLNDGGGRFGDGTAARLPTSSDHVSGVGLGDVDGDGDPDLVLANGFPGQQNRLYLNDGTGTFSDATAVRMPIDREVTEALALGDVDGDGDPDLVLANGGGFTAQQNRLYLNDGAGRFTDVTGARMPNAVDFTRAVALGDVDGDGDPDLVFGNAGRGALGQNRLYLNDGSGGFTDVTRVRMPTDTDVTLAVALGDVDGDGDPDLVLANGFPGQQNRLYLNDGTGAFADATAARMPVDFDTTFAVTLEDVDGDGDSDLVMGNGFFASQNRLYVNDGTGRFADATAVRMPVAFDDTRAVVLGDADGDGDPDLVFGNITEQNRLYLNDGSGVFTDATAARMPLDHDMTLAVALGDLDGDGDPDLVFGNHPASRVYSNLLRQLDSPFLVVAGREYRLDVYSRYGAPRLVDVAFPFVSLRTAGIPLPPLGTLGLDPLFLIPLPPFVIPRSAGVGSVSRTIPNAPGLIGLALHAQAFLLQWPRRAFLTNVMSDRIGR